MLLQKHKEWSWKCEDGQESNSTQTFNNCSDALTDVILYTKTQGDIHTVQTEEVTEDCYKYTFRIKQLTDRSFKNLSFLVF